MTTTYQILLFYHFVQIQNPQELMLAQKELWKKLNLSGRMIIAPEGLNATLEGTLKDTEAYIQTMRQDPAFQDIWFKKAPGTGHAFPKTSIKVRSEVVTLGRPDLNPHKLTGQYLTADQLHQWYTENKEFYLLDMRNDYEYEVGRFDDSLLVQNVRHFRDIPQHLETINHLRDKPVVTVCTGGIRCEKASGLLLEQGFQEVYQLHGGIHAYLEKYPDGFFRGKLYVFDGRVVASFGGKTDEVIGRCRLCQNPTEQFVNVDHGRDRMHFLMCPDCSGRYQGKIDFASYS